MVDYSKWKNIEVSDDEDDTHPNIDTPSLFKWRHEARVQRMKEFEEEKTRMQNEVKEFERRKQSVEKKLNERPNETSLQEQMNKLKLEEETLKERQEAFAKKERLMPWNVDTIGKESWSKTVINKPKARVTKEISEEEKNELYIKFVKENETKIKHYGMLSKWDDCKRFLLENPNLCCEETTNYLAIWCLDLQVEDKSQLMEHISKQVISMQYILELAKQLDCDPRSCISSFFTRIQKADKEYITAFEDELNAFRQRIKDRARARIEAAVKEVEEEERQQRLGPGGLDPIEVMETLPEAMRECFEKKDISLLQETLLKMDAEEARYHMKRCIDSGLWVAEADKEEGKLADPAKEAKEGDDETYEAVKEGPVDDKKGDRKGGQATFA